MNAQYCYGCMEPIGQEEVCPKCGFRQTDYHSEPHHLTPGTCLHDRYVVGKVLGEGGFGITYVGMDTFFERKVAIKEFYMTGYVIRDNTSSDALKIGGGTYGETFEKNREKFLLEARTLVKFEDEAGIVNIRDFFQENNTAYIVMDFLDGVTLRDYTKKIGKLSGEQVLKILEPVFHSLANIHAHGLIHRDISPDNIMLTKDGKVKLLDFGAARQVSERDIKSLSVILKPGYAPEEQYRSKGKQGPWTDLYALCATMYCCITGIVPDDAMERMFEDKLVPPAELDCDCTQEMSDVLMKGLSIRQADRYQSIPELWAAMTHPAKAEVPEDPERTIPREPLDAKTVVSGTEWAKTADIPKAPVEPVTAEPPRPVETQPEVQTEPETPEPPKSTETPKPEKQPEPAIAEVQKKKSKLPILLGIGLIALLAVLIFALGGNNTGEEAEMPDTDSTTVQQTEETETAVLASSEWSGEIPEQFSDFSVTLNGQTIAVPTTFEALEELGWVYAEEKQLVLIDAQNSRYRGKVRNGNDVFEVYVSNPTDYEPSYWRCPIERIEFWTDDLDSEHITIEIPGGFVLGKTTLAEFNAAAPAGYIKVDDYTAEYVTEDESQAYRFYFDYSAECDTDVLQGVSITNQVGIDELLAQYGHEMADPGFDPHSNREIYIMWRPNDEYWKGDIWFRSTITLPITVGQMGDWVPDSEDMFTAAYLENGVEAGHSTSTITLINGSDKIFVECKNMEDTTQPLENCTIRKIEVSTSFLESGTYTVETPGGYVLGQTTLAEFEATAPEGYEESSVGTARYYDHWFFGFNEEGILDTVRVNHH